MVGILKISPESSKEGFLQTLLILMVSPLAMVALITLGESSHRSSGMTFLLARHREAPVSYSNEV